MLISIRQLPAELRIKIYELALSDGRPLYIMSKTKAYRRLAVRCAFSTSFSLYRRYYDPTYEITDEPDIAEPVEPAVPNLLAVSKTIWSEAAPFLYSGPIVAMDTYTLLNFMSQIGPRHAALLRDVTICMWCTSRAHRSMNFPAMSLFAAAVNIEHLRIPGRLGWFWSSRSGKDEAAKRLARKVFRDCYPWMMAFGREKGDYTAAVDVIELGDWNFHRQYFQRTLDDNEANALKADKETYRTELRRLLQYVLYD
jgi:hypothetical protein